MERNVHSGKTVVIREGGEVTVHLKIELDTTGLDQLIMAITQLATAIAQNPSLSSVTPRTFTPPTEQPFQIETSSVPLKVLNQFEEKKLETEDIIPDELLGGSSFIDFGAPPAK